MKQTRWLTEAKAIADQAAVNGSVYYIMPTGEYTEFDAEPDGYAVISAVGIKELCFINMPNDYSVKDYVYDYCIYATDNSIEPNLEPERPEVEHYLVDYYTDHYQRDMPTSDYSIGLLFYARVNPQWSGKIEDFLERVREKELAKTAGSVYQHAVKDAIEERINNIHWNSINWAYECWEEGVKDNHHWIESVGRVGRSGGNIKLIASWPETTDELAEIAQDCIAIDAGIKRTIQWLESEEYRFEQYEVAFDIEEAGADRAEELQTCYNCDFINCTDAQNGDSCPEWRARLAVEPCS